MSTNPPPDPLVSMWSWIAYDLRFYRKRANLSGAQLGQILGVVRSVVSRLENGHMLLTDEQADAADVYFNTGGHFKRLLIYARRSGTASGVALLPSLIEQESRSFLIRMYQNAWIPGLLQTEDYIRAIPSRSDLVTARLERQQILHRDPPTQIRVILDEFALHRTVGGRETMRAQIRHLVELSEWPNVDIRVVPADTGAYIGLDGTFMILSLPDGDVVYRETARESQFVSLLTEVREFQHQYDQIGQSALTVKQSRDLLKERMEDR